MKNKLVLELEYCKALLKAKLKMKRRKASSKSPWHFADKVGLADQNSLRLQFEEQCDASLSKFERRVDSSWAERSILMSEGFAVCAMADLYKIDCLIESGTYNGRSAEIFAQYFDGHPSLNTVDIKIRKQAVERLSAYKNTTLYEGEGHQKILKLLSNMKDKKVGVFIDGPKGKKAVLLTLELLNHPEVAFVGIHDLHARNYDGQTRSICRRLFDAVIPLKISTDEEFFVDKYRKLDCSENGRDLDQGLEWRPYMFVDPETETCKRHLGSYGPTIAFATLSTPA